MLSNGGEGAADSREMEGWVGLQYSRARYSIFVLMNPNWWTSLCLLLQLCRVVRVRQRIISLLNGANSLRGEAVWSRRHLISWCRANLCTPLDNGRSFLLIQTVVTSPVKPKILM